VLAFQLLRENHAFQLLRENLEIQRRRLGPDHQLTLRTASQLALALIDLDTDDALAEAETLTRGASETWIRTMGADHPETLSSRAAFGYVLALRGKLEEARSIFAPLPDAYSRRLGPDNFHLGETCLHYGLVFEALGDLDGAEAQYRRAGQILEKSKEAGLQEIVSRVRPELEGCQARLALTRGRDDEARKWFRATLRADRIHPEWADRLDDVLAERADPVISRQILMSMYNWYSGLSERLDWLRPYLQSLIGSCLLREGKHEVAARNLQSAVVRMEASHLKSPARFLDDARARLARVPKGPAEAGASP
jgi:tetratricopeptide (TPR) repeat protein